MRIPESHDVKTPFIELPGPVYEIVEVFVGPVIEQDCIQVIDDIKRIAGALRGALNEAAT